MRSTLFFILKKQRDSMAKRRYLFVSDIKLENIRHNNVVKVIYLLLRLNSILGFKFDQI